jgi:hypothetical protein
MRRRLIQFFFNFGGCAGLYSKFTKCASYQKGWQDQTNMVRIASLLFPLSIVIVSARARARKLPTQFPHSREFWPAMTQVQQKAACNAGARYTKPDVRCAWDDLAGPDLPLTPELIAQMMGGRRTSVTEVAGDMPRRELSSSARGRFHMWINRVHEQARECHAAIGRMRI